jgi:hypothetical protein
MFTLVKIFNLYSRNWATKAKDVVNYRKRMLQIMVSYSHDMRWVLVISTLTPRCMMLPSLSMLIRHESS